MEKIKNYIVLGVITILILIPTIYFIKSKVKIKNQERRITELQKEVISKDSTYHIVDGLYKRTVADLYTSKELNTELKAINKQLSSEVRKLKGSVIMLQEINLQLRDKKDTVIIREGEVDKDRVLAYYPNSTKPLIKFSRDYQETKYLDSWEFSTFKIDMVVIQEPTGRFTALFDAPDWIRLNSLNVKTTPLITQKEDNFDWITMIGVQQNMVSKQYGLELDLGFRYKKSMWIIGASTDNTIGVKYGKLW